MSENDKQIDSLQRQVQHYRARLREVVDEYEAKLLNLRLQAEDVINELQGANAPDSPAMDADDVDESDNEEAA